MQNRLRRSVLYVPGANQRAIARARSVPADAIVLDLEDSVTPERKAEARETVAAALEDCDAWGGRELIVRLNGLGSPWLDADVAVIAATAPDAVLLPKPATAEDIWHLKRLLVLARPRTPLAIWAMIETPAAVLNAPRLAAAVGPDGALVMGLNDLARETGAIVEPGRESMRAALAMTVLAARSEGIAAIDAVFNDLADGEGLAAECRQGRVLGFDGKSLVHPAQVEAANAAFGPTVAEIAEAEAIVAAFRQPHNADKGVIVVAGRMVERLHLGMAERLLARRDASRR